MRECSGKRCVDCYGLGPWQTSEWCLVSSQKVGIVEAFAFWKEKAMPLAHAHFTPLYWPLAIPHMEVFSQITVFSSHTWWAPGARGHCPVTLTWALGEASGKTGICLIGCRWQSTYSPFRGHPGVSHPRHSILMYAFAYWYRCISF